LAERDWAAEEGPTAAEKEIERPALSAEVHRETTRAHLAKWLMALLTLTVLTILLLAGLEMAGLLEDNHDGQLGNLAQLVLTPVVTLVGTALGFYFGAQSVTEHGGNGGMPAPRPPGKIRRLGNWLW
jgi:hypothetical protein